jgi:trk system potassium uptake protein TrkH
MRQFNSNFGIWLYERNPLILRWNRVVINIASLAVLVLMLARYGFNLEKDVETFWIPAIRTFYFIYAFNYFFRFLLARKRWEFIKSQWFESLIFLMIILNGFSYFVLSTSQIQKFISGEGKFYELFLLIMLLLLAFIEFIKSLNFIVSGKIKPAMLFIISYLILIFVGTSILMLPGFNFNYEFMDFFDALFTATSATCITGLSSINIGEYFNIKGQILVLILFQVGGIGILTFASFFATFIRRGLGIKHQIMMNELFDSDSISGSFALLKRILLFLFGFEIIGFCLMYFAWGDYPFESDNQKIFFTIFHTVSAFCQAGFSLFQNGLETEGVNSLYGLHWVVIVLVFFSSIGFSSIRDIFSISNLKLRIAQPWRKWKTGTKISVYTGLVLLFIGAFANYFLEIKGHKNVDVFFNKITVSFFQSASLRSLGMSAVSLENLASPLIMISMFLMFIGGGSSSLSGGIKTSTFIVAVVAIVSTIRGRKEPTIGRRTISSELIYKAFAIILFSGNFILLTVMLLTFTEPDVPFLKLSWEAVSAVCNVGSSMGITGDLSNAGKVILAVGMYAGRVGFLSLAFALSSKEKPNTLRYPKTHIIIG